MPDFKDRGAPHAPDDALKGEVLASLSEWNATYGTVRLELAWTVLQMLLKHVEREGLTEYVEFCERASAALGEQAKGVTEVFEEDHRNRMH